MEGFLTDLGKTFAEKLINGAIEKSRYVFCFKCIAKEFEEEKVKLEAERTTMRQRFRVAIEKDKEIQFNAQVWDERSDKLIQEDTKTKQRCFFGFCPNCIWRYKRGEELANKTEEIKKLMEKGEKLENVELARHLPDVERYSSRYYISFKSREVKYKELLVALKDDNNYTIGLHGMGGTGKTTLAKEVGKQLKTLKQFNHVIDTTVSFTPDIKKIQDDIAGSLGLEWGDINESDRPKKLWSRLTNGDKILVILDDVWGNLSFDDIGIPNSDNHKGCKVLVTTRDLRVCNKMGCGETIQLELLSKEDAWIMFKMHAHLSNVSSKSFLDKGYKITTECKRLPVAIATIASSLKGQKRLKEWDIVLKSLQKNVSMGGVDEDLVDIYKCLKFSYDYLKNEKAKRLFLLCSVFHEDEEMSIEILARLSIAVGLFGEDYCSYEDARSQAVVAKNKLLDSCLLLETENGEVKMHDLVREVAKWMANKEIQEVNLYNKNQQSLIERDKDVKYLLCEGNLLGFFSSKFDGSKLEILIVKMKVSYRTMDFPISFFENAVGLRVLNLKNKVAWHIRKKPKLLLPKSIQSLTNIRSLLVEEFNLGDISIFGSLRSLETLDLDHCQFDELPCEIIKLEKLRLLNLVHCEIRCNNPFDVIQKCSSLEELYFCHSFNEFCKEITLPSLGRYYLTDVPSVIMNDSLSKCVTIQRDYFSEATYKYVMQTTELLQLYIRKGWRNLMPEIVPIDQGMNDLIELRLRYDSQLQCLVDTKHIDSQVPNVFSKLVVLKLDEMENLEELCNGPISFDSLNNLEKLKIMYCRNLRILFNGNLNLCNLKTVTLRKCSTLVSVFDLSTSRSLLLLEKLEIIGCEKLENIVTYDNNKICCNSMFPKLKIVDIKRCHQLQFVIPLLSAKDLLLLESINIESCDKLNYIFGQHQDVKLTSLKELQLIDLPNFIDIFPESYHSTKSSSIEGSSNSISKPQTQLEPIKSNIFSWSHICYGYKLRGSTSTKIPLVSEDQPKDCSISLESSSYRLNTRDHADECLLRLSHVMCNIKKIRLMKLSKIKSVFILSIARIMSSLESLTIESCYELKNIVEDIGDDSGRGNIVFPKLKKLKVENCEKLEYIFGIHINASVHHQNHHINEVIHLHLPALESLELRSLPSLMGVCGKNYCTTFPPLTVLQLFECPQVVTKSIGDFVCSSIFNPRDSTSTTIKDLVGNVEHFIALENLKVANSKLQSIFYLDEMNGQQINLGLQEIEFYDLLQMTYLFVGRRNCFALQNLLRIKVVRCDKLEMIFSTCVLKCLPQLLHLRIEQCDELKYIIEEDHVEKNEISNDHMSPIRTCFPKLKTLVVRNCNKLKYVFPASVCTELPELWFLMIRETSKLGKIFGGSEENDQIVEIPKLRLVVFVELPSFFQDQGIEFQTVEFRLVRKCQNLSLTSTTKTPILSWRIPLDDIDYVLYRQMWSLGEQLKKDSKNRDTSGGNLNGTEVESSTSGHENGIETNKFETDSGLKIPSVSISQCLKETEDQSIEECSTSETRNELPIQLVADLKQKCSEEPAEKQSIEECSTSETRNEPPIQIVADLKQKGIKLSVEDTTTLLPTAKTITSSLEYGDFQIAVPFAISTTKEPLTIEEDIDIEGSHKTTQTNNQVSLNDDATMKVNSNIEEQFPKDEVLVSRSRLSCTTSQFLSMPSKDFDLFLHMESVYRQFQEGTKGRHSDNENSSSQTSKEFAAWIEAEIASRHKLISSEVTEINVEEGTTSTDAKTISSSTTHLELVGSSSGPLVTPECKTFSQIKMKLTPETDQELVENVPNLKMQSVALLPTNSEENGDGKISIPSFSNVNTKPPATKYVDIGDSQETIAMEDINKLIEEDPILALVALEKLLTGQVSISSVRVLLRELKTLMDSSSDLDHLVSNQESISKLNSLFHRLNQHQGMLTSALKDFVEKVQNFFNENIIKHATSQQALKKHNQLLDSKTDIMNKLWSVKSTQTHIDSETSTTNAQIHELSLQIDELRKKLADLENQRDSLKSVANKCDVQKMKLKAECTELAQQSKKFFSALASSEVDLREAEHARNLAIEGFSNLKSSFPRL